MDKFLVYLSGGVHIRRHQSNHISEMVRLFSVNGCRTISWSKVVAKDLSKQRKLEGKYADGSTSAVYATTYDRTGFDCCISCKF